ncbi:MAG: radical SAM protein [Polyangiales bacterium]
MNPPNRAVFNAPNERDGELRGWRLGRVRAAMTATLLRRALDAYDAPVTALRAAKDVTDLAHRVAPWGDHMVLHRGRVFGRQARPGFPSHAFDRFIGVELNKQRPYRAGFDLPTALVAVTRRCALRCQHCSAWESRGPSDPLSIEALRAVVAALLDRGVAHLELTGGEPLLRLDAVEAIARDASTLADVWVLTSGAPMTAEHARRLADAGVTGVMVSLDHWDATRHDAFRGVEGTFDHALEAMTLTRDEGLLVGASFTATRATANPTDLLRVVGVARKHGASFVRLLDPQPADGGRTKTSRSAQHSAPRWPRSQRPPAPRGPTARRSSRSPTPPRATRTAERAAACSSTRRETSTDARSAATPRATCSATASTHRSRGSAATGATMRRS